MMRDFLFQVFQHQPDERSDLLGLQLLSHLILMAGFTGFGALPGCLCSRWLKAFYEIIMFLFFEFV